MTLSERLLIESGVGEELRQNALLDSYVSMNKSFAKYKKRVADAFSHRILIPGIQKVIFNDPATIILWDDGSKTVVKAHDEPFDKEKGLAMAIAKKALGNRGRYFEVFKDYCEE